MSGTGEASGLSSISGLPLEPGRRWRPCSDSWKDMWEDGKPVNVEIFAVEG